MGIDCSIYALEHKIEGYLDRMWMITFCSGIDSNYYLHKKSVYYDKALRGEEKYFYTQGEIEALGEYNISNMAKNKVESRDSIIFKNTRMIEFVKKFSNDKYLIIPDNDYDEVHMILDRWKCYDLCEHIDWESNYRKEDADWLNGIYK